MSVSPGRKSCKTPAVQRTAPVDGVPLRHWRSLECGVAQNESQGRVRCRQSDPPSFVPTSSPAGDHPTEISSLQKNLQRELQRSFENRVNRDYPIVDFVHSVWKFGPEQIPTRRGGYSIPYKLCNQYGSSLNTADRLHGSFGVMKRIFEHVLGQLNTPQTLLASFKYTQEMPTSHRDAVVPTFAWSTTEEVCSQQWRWFGLVGHLSKTEQKVLGLKRNLRVDLSHFRDRYADSDDEVLSACRKRRRHSDVTPRKRPRLASKVTEHHSAAPRKPLSPEELQAAAYATESLSSGARLYTTGISILETEVKLWYADRMGIVFSTPFDFLAEPHLLLLVLGAIASSTLDNLGVCPILKLPQSSRYDTYSDSVIELAGAYNPRGGKLPHLRFKFDSEREAHFAYGAVGRGTSVIPIKPIRSSNSLCRKEKLVAKMAWASIRRPAEDMTIRTIRKRLRQDAPDILQHVSDMKCSIARTAQDMGLPRVFMSELPVSEERVFRTLVLKAYEPLAAVNNAEEFKAIFKDAVRAHHYVWNVAGVLHRDISISNVMFYRKDTRVIGVLSDWDIARSRSDIEADEDEVIQHREQSCAKFGHRYEDCDYSHPLKHRSVVREIAGTIPFVAIDLLTKKKTPVHTYQHDLESFFFLLIYFCVCHDPVERRIGHIKEWEQDDFGSVGKVKTEFLVEKERFWTLCGWAHPTYRGILDAWANELRLLMLEARTKAMEEEVMQHQRVLFAGRNGSWEDDITPPTLEDVATYRSLTFSNFMACLGAEVHPRVPQRCR